MIPHDKCMSGWGAAKNTQNTFSRTCSFTKQRPSPRQEEKAGLCWLCGAVFASGLHVPMFWIIGELQNYRIARGFKHIQTTSEYLGRILGGISNSLSWQMITWFLEFSAGKWRKRLPKRRGSWNSWALSTPFWRVVQLELGHLWRSNDLQRFSMWILHVLLPVSALDWSQLFPVSDGWSHIFNILCPVKSMDCAWLCHAAMQCTVRALFWLWSPQDAEKKRREKARWVILVGVWGINLGDW